MFTSPSLYFVILATLAQHALSLTFPGPGPTLQRRIEEAPAASPVPTYSPSFVDVIRRASSAVPNNTCGWDTTGVGLTCVPGTACVFYEPKSAVGMAGCCGGTDWQTCGWSNTCYDYEEVIVSNKCDADCFRNSFAIKCSSSESRYCQSWTYPGQNIKDYGCGTNGASTYTALTWSSTGDKGGVISVTPKILRKDEVTGWETGSAASQTSTTSSSGSPSPESEDKTKDNSNAGVIAGAVVGAVVGVALVIGAVVLILHRRIRRGNNGSGTVYSQVPASGHDSHLDGSDKFPSDTAYSSPTETAQLHMTPVQEAPSPNNTFAQPAFAPTELATPQSTYYSPGGHEPRYQPVVHEMGTGR